MYALEVTLAVGVALDAPRVNVLAGAVAMFTTLLLLLSVALVSYRRRCRLPRGGVKNESI
jgi:hypothetical protein